jgi:hypothetical protein
MKFSFCLLSLLIPLALFGETEQKLKPENRKPAQNATAGEYYCTSTRTGISDLQRILNRMCDSSRHYSISSTAGSDGLMPTYAFCCIAR